VTDLDLREAMKTPLHEALHGLDVRITNLTAGDCHCNLVAEVALDVVAPIALARITELEAERDEARAERERIFADHQSACALVAKMHRAAVGEVRGPIRGVSEDVEDLRAERDAMRPVVEAAEAMTADWVGDRAKWPIMAAVDVWRAAQPDQEAPETAPEATQADERGADDGAGTEGPQAQGGVQDPVEHYFGGFRPSPAEPHAPADPPGLAEAIEAAWAEYCTRLIDDDRVALEFAVRAAAPILVKAALLEAADEIAAKARSGYVGGVVDGLGIAERLIRQRADRIGGGE
jgi:hypothetical protein